MNAFSLALKLFRNNVKTYTFHIVVMTVAVAVYYDFMSLKHNPEVLQSQEVLLYAKSAAQITSVVTLIVLVFFMWYSSSFFLKQRTKEIGIYALAGISNAKIGLVFAVESIFTGLTSLAGGLLFGILFSKLFMMALAKAALLKVTVPFTIPKSAVTEVIITFGIIFLAMSAGNFLQVVRKPLIDLIHQSKKDEAFSRYNIPSGILAILLLGSGYYLSANVFALPNFLLGTLAVVILVIIGTYFFFGSFLSVFLRYLINNKKIMYQGVRIVGISNIAFRLRGNYRSLAILAVMAATAITAFGTSLSLKYYVDQTHAIEFPYSFSYISENETLREDVLQTIRESEHALQAEVQLKYLYIPSARITKDVWSTRSFLAVKYPDFVQVITTLNPENAEKILEQAKPASGAVTFIEAPGVIASTYRYTGSIVQMTSREFLIEDYLKAPLLGSGENMPVLVMSDEDYTMLQADFTQITFNGFLVENAEKSIPLALELRALLPENSHFFAYAGAYQSSFRFIGLFFFLGGFMSIVFVLATGSIMYFKLLSEGLADKEKYDLLKKIGMTKDEIKRAVSAQVGLSLLLPLLLGILHSLFAINVLEKFLNYNLLLPTLAAIAVFAFCYTVFFMATTKKFLQIVWE
jgi:putative ABC transport system permease protein